MEHISETGGSRADLNTARLNHVLDNAAWYKEQIRAAEERDRQGEGQTVTERTEVVASGPESGTVTLPTGWSFDVHKITVEGAIAAPEQTEVLFEPGEPAWLVESHHPYGEHLGQLSTDTRMVYVGDEPAASPDAPRVAVVQDYASRPYGAALIPAEVAARDHVSEHLARLQQVGRLYGGNIEQLYDDLLNTLTPESAGDVTLAGVVHEIETQVRAAGTSVTQPERQIDGVPVVNFQVHFPSEDI